MRLDTYFQQCGMCDQQSPRSDCAHAQSDQSLCLSLDYSMNVKLLNEHNLEFLSIKGGGTGSSESSLVKMPHCCKTCLKRPLKIRPKIGFQDRLSLNAGQKYCRMLQGEHSEILSTFIKLPFVIKIIVFDSFEWPLKTGFTVYIYLLSRIKTFNACCNKHQYRHRTWRYQTKKQISIDPKVPNKVYKHLHQL